MRSTRASAAWAGVALATSFLSVAITSMQPHTTDTSTAITANVTLPSSRSEDSLRVLERVDAVAAKAANLDTRSAGGSLYGLIDRTP